MAGPFDILGNADEERLQALAEADQRRFAETFRANQSRKAFQAAQQENRRLENTAALLGVETPEEPEQGFLGRTLDILDTGGQMVRGVAAKYAGVPEFEDKDILSAALFGDEKDLTTGEILRQKGILQGDDWGSAIGRFAAGFAGDVLSDPVTYLSLGTSGIAKTGGAPVINEAVTGAFARHADDLVAAAEKSVAERVARGVLDKGAAADEVAQLTLAAERKAANPVRILRRAADTKKKLRWLGLEGSELDLATDALAAEKGLKPLGLAADLSPEAILAKPAIRISSAFPGLLSGHFTVPLFNTKGVTDIPFITQLSEKAFDKLGGKWYNANMKVGQFIDRAVLKSKSPDAKLWEKAAAVALDYPRTIARGAAEAISREARVGNVLAREDLDELTAARMGVIMNRSKQRLLMSKGLEPEDLELATEVMESGLRQHLNAVGHITSKASDVKFDKQIFDGALNEAAKALDSKAPGKGQRFIEVINQARHDFDAMGAEAVEKGLLGHQNEGYVRRIIRGKPGAPIQDSAVDDLVKRMTRGGKGWDMERSYITAVEAKIKGYDVNTNLLDSWLERSVGHDFAVHEKDFFDRLALETGIKRSTYDAISAKLASANAEEASGAIAQLKVLGIDGDPKTVQKALDASAGLYRHTSGEVMSPSSYSFLERMVKEGGVSTEQVAAYEALEGNIKNLRSEYVNLRRSARIAGFPKKAMKATLESKKAEYLAAKEALAGMGLDQNAVAAYREAQKVGLTFSDAEKQAVAEGYSKFEAGRSRILGRNGENFFTRSGAEPLSPRVKAFFDKQASRLNDPELIDFYKGVLPRSVSRAIDEAYDTRSTLQRLQDWAKDDAGKKAIAASAAGYMKFMKYMKLGATQFFPAYHTQNFSGSFIQASHALPLLGSAMNPVAIIKNAELLRNPEAFIEQAVTGRRFSSQQVHNFLDGFKVRATLGGYTDALNAHSNALDAITSFDDVAKQGKGVVGKLTSKLRSVSEWVENQGRQHTFIELLRQGNSPEDAARIANQVLIDYSRNKTPWERHFANHLFFFYTFPRQQTSNTLHALITRPGAISGQLHLVEGVRDALSNDEELRNMPNIDDRMLSLRAKETFGRVIGTDAQGLPEVLSQVGVPIQDLSRMMEIRFPEKMTVGSLLEAGGESVQRTSQLLLSQTAPPVKMIAELISGKNLFFDRPITDKSIRRLPKIEDAVARIIPYGYQKIPKALGSVVDAFLWKWMDPVDNGDGTVTVNPVNYSIMTNLFPPIARAANTIKAGIKEGVPMDRKLSRMLLPVKVSSLDFDKSGVYDRNRQLESFFENKSLPTSKAQVSFYQRNNDPDEVEDDAIERELEE